MMQPEVTTDAREEFVGRLFMASLDALEVLAVYVGGALGLYATLHADGPATVEELAGRASIARRYAQEWLEQQAAAGILTVDDAGKEPDARVYSLPAAHVEALLDRDSGFSIEPLVRTVGSITSVLPQIIQAFRTGGGVPWSAYGTDGIEAQGDFNRPWLKDALGSTYLPSVPDLHARLADGSEPARVADVCCGVGWAAIAIAKAYPDVRVDGFDLDEHSITLARKNAAEAGVADRVRFERRDAADPANAGLYDFAIVVEAIHDLADPVGVLRAINTMLKPSGVAVIADERVGETFTAPADETDRFMYAASLFICLPAGLADAPSVGTGTVMRPDTFRRYARDAGFASVEILDRIDHPMLRFYRLEPGTD